MIRASNASASSFTSEEKVSHSLRMFRKPLRLSLHLLVSQ